MGSLIVINDIKLAKREDIIAELCGSNQVIDETTLQGIIDDIIGEIEDELTDIYTIPDTDQPKILKKIAVWYVIHKLYGRSHKIPTHVQKDYDRAKELIEEIQTRKIVLGDSDDDFRVSQLHDEKSFDPDELFT